MDSVPPSTPITTSIGEVSGEGGEFAWQRFPTLIKRRITSWTMDTGGRVLGCIMVGTVRSPSKRK
jgi:hypothetical protein